MRSLTASDYLEASVFMRRLDYVKAIIESGEVSSKDILYSLVMLNAFLSCKKFSNPEKFEADEMTIRYQDILDYLNSYLDLNVGGTS